MKIKIIFTVVFMIVYLTLFNFAFAQSNITAHLSAGEYNVGFKLFHVYDKTRSYHPKYHYFGKTTGHQSGRPMQISMWYPSNNTADGKQLFYRDYVGYAASEVDFGKNTANAQKQLLNQIIGSVTLPYQKRLREMYDQPVKAFNNAPMADGEFPLVLYAPPLNTQAYDNHILCEYLASKGYIVLAVAAKGEYGRTQNPTVREVHVQADDLAFMLQFGRQQTKSDKVGTVGFSIGGLSNLIFASKNQDIDATVSLDGSIMSMGWLKDIKQSVYYDPSSFGSNLLMISKNLKDPKLNPATFYNEVKYTNKTLIRFDHSEHGYFSSDKLLTSLLFDDQMTDKDKQARFGFYAQMTRYVGDFLDTHLKDGDQLQAQPQKAIRHSFDFANSSRRPIQPETVSPLILANGYEYIDPIISDILSYQSDYLTKLRWRDLNNTADQLAKTKRLPEAIKTLLLSTKAFPDWYQTHAQLAGYYEQDQDKLSATKHYILALKDNPRHHASIKALKTLNGAVADYHQTVLSEDALKKYLGKYIVDDKRFRKIYIENNKLYLYSNYWANPLQLWPYSKDRFLIEDDNPLSNMQILFQFDQNGNVVSLKTRGLNSGRVGQGNLKEKD